MTDHVILESKCKCIVASSIDEWNRTSHPLTKREFGVWELLLPDLDFGTEPVKHGTKYKVTICLHFCAKAKCLC